MKLASLQDVYRHPGPFATVYLDTTTDAEGAAVDLRWRSARQRLAEQGADEETLRAIGEHIGEPGAGQRGQVLVAEQGEVVLDDELPRPPSEVSEAYFGPVPQLMPYLRLRGPHIPHVVAAIDHVGADITVVHPTSRARTATVDGPTADQVAAEIGEYAEQVHARAIVLAGDPEQRRLVHERMPASVQDQVVETDTTHRDRKVCGETLRDEVAKTVNAAVEARIAEAVREFEQERARPDRAVEGWEATLAALRGSRVRALLWAHRESRPTDLYIGSGAGEVATDDTTLRESGSDHIDVVPADAAIVRALAGTGGEFFPVDPERIQLTDGVGALLRY